MAAKYIAHLYVHAVSTQKKRSPKRTTSKLYPKISKCCFPPSGTSSIFHRLTSVSIGRGEPPPSLKSLGPHATFRRRRNAKRRRSRLDAGAGGGVDDTRRTMPSTPWM